MAFAGKWLVGTLAILMLVLLVSFLVPIKDEKSALAPFVYELYDGGPTIKINSPAARRMAQRLCKQYYDSAMLWRLVKKEYPRDLQAMAAPLRPGEGAYLKVVNDPWGNLFYLEIDGRKLRVWSSGPDAQEGTDDDISYPEMG